MAQERKRRRFTAEYKAEAVKRLGESGKGLQQGAGELRGARQTAPAVARRASGGRLRRGPGPAEGRGSGAGPAEAREQAAGAGERDPQAGRRFFRPGGGPDMRYRFVAAERATSPVRRLGRLVGVAASGFYAWLRRGPGRRAGEDAGLAGRIAATFEAIRRTYGSPRIHAELRDGGLRIGRGRVARLMREAGLSAARRRRVPRTTDSRHDHPVAPNLLG